MSREHTAARQARVRSILDVLARTYPDAHCELDYSNPLELLVATILSAQCTDKRVNIVTKELFRVCKTAADYVALPQERLEEIVRSAGFFRAAYPAMSRFWSGVTTTEAAPAFQVAGT